jgi:predicted nucleic acid-binding protein
VTAAAIATAPAAGRQPWFLFFVTIYSPSSILRRIQCAAYYGADGSYLSNRQLDLVDTNVLVYARDASEPAKQARASEWLRELWLEQRGRTSAQVLSEYYTTVTRKLRPGLTPDEAWDDVTALFAWQPQKIDRLVLENAREIERRHALSWARFDDRGGRAASELRGTAVGRSTTRLDLRYRHSPQAVCRPNRGSPAELSSVLCAALAPSTARQAEEASLIGRLRRSPCS